jgi:membrane protein implicated in regulation of membrane protease activity
VVVEERTKERRKDTATKSITASTSRERRGERGQEEERKRTGEGRVKVPGSAWRRGVWVEWSGRG